MVYCEDCFSKQRKIDALTEEVSRLKIALRYEERKDKEGYFGSSTPSSRIPVKANSIEENQRRRGGARPGQPGHGRYRRGFLTPLVTAGQESPAYRFSSAAELSPVHRGITIPLLFYLT